MMRLIDADALYDAGCRWADEHYYFEFDSFEEVVDSAPTIDPVKHGHWIDGNDEYVGVRYIKCSECGKRFCSEYGLEELEQDYKFCPHCGTLMEDESDAVN